MLACASSGLAYPDQHHERDDYHNPNGGTPSQQKGTFTHRQHKGVLALIILPLFITCIWSSDGLRRFSQVPYLPHTVHRHLDAQDHHHTRMLLRH